MRYQKQQWISNSGNPDLEFTNKLELQFNSLEYRKHSQIIRQDECCSICIYRYGRIISKYVYM